MMREHIIHIDAERCIGCGLCQRDCPANNISIIEKTAVVKAQNCIKCGHCVAVCPKGAVSMTGFDEPPVEIQEPSNLDPQLLLKAIRNRRSIRQFKAQAVPAEILEQVIEAGRLTPTGKNAQDVSYIVLEKDLEHCEAIAVRLFQGAMPLAQLVSPIARNHTIDNHFFFKKAPAAIVILSKDKVNGALAASNMALMAEACGLGVLYSGFFTMAANMSPALRKALQLHHKDKAVTTLVLGYSNVTYHRNAQKDTAAVRWF